MVDHVDHPDELAFVRWRAIFQKCDYSDLESLKLIRNTFDRLRLNKSKDLVAATKAIADEGKDEDWRLPIGESGILDVALIVITTPGIDDDLAKQCLRIIGNVCIDTDANRERIVAQNTLPTIIAQLQTEPWLALPVLINIIVDYKPAEEAAKQHDLCPALGSLMITFGDQGKDIAGILPNVCSLYDIIVDEELDTSRCAENEVDILLMEASEPDIGADEFISLIRAFVAHLREERLQQQVVAKKLIPDILDMVVRTYSSNPFHGTSLIDRCPKRLPLEPKDEIGLSRCRDGLIASLSDVSATPAFAKEHPVDSDLVDTLCAWFSVDEPSIQRCACLMIGNLARSDAVCKDMVHRMGLHELLITILVKSNDLQLLHATLGFLRNLALRVENKGTIAGSNVLEPLSKIWASSSSPQLQYEAVRVVRQLVNGSLANIQRLLMPLAWGENADDNSYVSQLVALFRQTDEVPTKFEISRTMAAIWRCVRSPASTQYFSDIVEVILPRLHSMTAELAKPLSAMVTQTRWPVIKSEGWFALALMARSKEGSDAIINQLSEAELSNALIGVIGARKAVPKENISVATGNEVSITGADTSDLKPEPKEVMETKDGDNALVLVTELLKNSSSRMSSRRRNALEELLHGVKTTIAIQDSG